MKATVKFKTLQPGLIGAFKKVGDEVSGAPDVLLTGSHSRGWIPLTVGTDYKKEIGSIPVARPNAKYKDLKETVKTTLEAAYNKPNPPDTK